MKAIARLVEPSSLISVHSLDVAPVSHSLNRLICQGFVGSRVDRKHLASEDVDKFRMKKQKALEEKFAKLGEYVLIVEDVTNPPFMNRRLEPDFLLMKLKQPPKEFKRESKKWDTSSHIKASMRVKEDEILSKKHLKD